MDNGYKEIAVKILPKFMGPSEADLKKERDGLFKTIEKMFSEGKQPVCTITPEFAADNAAMDELKKLIDRLQKEHGTIQINFNTDMAESKIKDITKAMNISLKRAEKEAGDSGKSAADIFVRAFIGAFKSGSFKWGGVLPAGKEMSDLTRETNKVARSSADLISKLTAIGQLASAYPANGFIADKLEADNLRDMVRIALGKDEDLSNLGKVLEAAESKMREAAVNIKNTVAEIPALVSGEINNINSATKAIKESNAEIRKSEEETANAVDKTATAIEDKAERYKELESAIKDYYAAKSKDTKKSTESTQFFLKEAKSRLKELMVPYMKTLESGRLEPYTKYIPANLKGNNTVESVLENIRNLLGVEIPEAAQETEKATTAALAETQQATESVSDTIADIPQKVNAPVQSVEELESAIKQAHPELTDFIQNLRKLFELKEQWDSSYKEYKKYQTTLLSPYFEIDRATESLNEEVNRFLLSGVTGENKKGIEETINADIFLLRKLGKTAEEISSIIGNAVGDISETVITDADVTNLKETIDSAISKANYELENSDAIVKRLISDSNQVEEKIHDIIDAIEFARFKIADRDVSNVIGNSYLLEGFIESTKTYADALNELTATKEEYINKFSEAYNALPSPAAEPVVEAEKEKQAAISNTIEVIGEEKAAVEQAAETVASLNLTESKTGQLAIGGLTEAVNVEKTVSETKALTTALDETASKEQEAAQAGTALAEVQENIATATKEAQQAQSNMAQPIESDVLSSIADLLPSIAENLTAIKAVISDIGDGEELSPLLSSIQEITDAVRRLEETVSKVNFNINIGDNRSKTAVDAAFNKAARNAVNQAKVAANALLDIKELEQSFSGGTGGANFSNVGQWLEMSTAIFNSSSFDKKPNRDKLDQLKDYIDFMKEAADRAGVSLDGWTDKYGNALDTAIAKVDDVTSSEKEVENQTKKIQGIFGESAKIDLGGVSGQLEDIIAKLGEIASVLAEIATKSEMPNITDNLQKLSADTAALTEKSNQISTALALPSPDAPTESIEREKTSLEELASAAGKAREAKDGITTTDFTLRNTTYTLIEAINVEAAAMQNLSESAGGAAEAKKAFTEANELVFNAAQASSEALEKESAALRGISVNAQDIKLPSGEISIVQAPVTEQSNAIVEKGIELVKEYSDEKGKVTRTVPANADESYWTEAYDAAQNYIGIIGEIKQIKKSETWGKLALEGGESIDTKLAERWDVTGSKGSVSFKSLDSEPSRNQIKSFANESKDALSDLMSVIKEYETVSKRIASEKMIPGDVEKADDLADKIITMSDSAGLLSDDFDRFNDRLEQADKAIAIAKAQMDALKDSAISAANAKMENYSKQYGTAFGGENLYADELKEQSEYVEILNDALKRGEIELKDYDAEIANVCSSLETMKKASHVVTADEKENWIAKYADNTDLSTPLKILKGYVSTLKDVQQDTVNTKESQNSLTMSIKLSDTELQKVKLTYDSLHDTIIATNNDIQPHNFGNSLEKIKTDLDNINAKYREWKTTADKIQTLNAKEVKNPLSATEMLDRDNLLSQAAQIEKEYDAIVSKAAESSQSVADAMGNKISERKAAMEKDIEDLRKKAEQAAAEAAKALSDSVEKAIAGTEKKVKDIGTEAASSLTNKDISAKFSTEMEAASSEAKKLGEELRNAMSKEALTEYGDKANEVIKNLSAQLKNAKADNKTADKNDAARTKAVAEIESARAALEKYKEAANDALISKGFTDSIAEASKKLDDLDARLLESPTALSDYKKAVKDVMGTLDEAKKEAFKASEAFVHTAEWQAKYKNKRNAQVGNENFNKVFDSQSNIIARLRTELEETKITSNEFKASFDKAISVIDMASGKGLPSDARQLQGLLNSCNDDAKALNETLGKLRVNPIENEERIAQLDQELQRATVTAGAIQDKYDLEIAKQRGIIASIQTSTFNGQEFTGWIAPLETDLKQCTINLDEFKSKCADTAKRLRELSNAGILLNGKDNYVSSAEQANQLLNDFYAQRGLNRTEGTQEFTNDMTSSLEKVNQVLVDGEGKAHHFTATMTEGFVAVKETAVDAAKASNSVIGGFIDTVKGKLRTLTAYWAAMLASPYRIIGYVKKLTSLLEETDKQLVTMRQVSGKSIDTLQAFQRESYKIADSVGSTAQIIQSSTVDWMRLGESIDDAKESAAAAARLMNVSNFSNINDASTALVAVSKAYNEMSKNEIVDVMSAIGNNFAIATDELATALKSSSSVLKAQGNDLAKAAAIITAGNETVQDAAKTGTAMRTIALRIAGTKIAKDEMEQMGEDVSDFIVRTASKTQEDIKKLTAVKSNDYLGVDILEANGNLKDTYDILLGIADVYKEIQKEDKQAGTNRAQALLEVLGGKRGAVNVGSLLSNPETLKKAYEAASNAAGYAARTQEEYMKGIEAHLAQLKNKWNEIWQSDNARDVVNLILNISKAVLTLVDKLGVLRTALLAISAYTALRGKGLFQIIPKNGTKEILLFGKSLTGLGAAIKGIKLNGLSGLTAWVKGFIGVGKATSTAATAEQLAQIESLNKEMETTGISAAAAAQKVTNLDAAVKSYATTSGATAANPLSQAGLEASMATPKIVKMGSAIGSVFGSIGTMFVFTLAIQAVMKLIGKIKDLANESQKAKEKARELQDAYATEKDKLEDINDQLKDNQERIDELVAKGEARTKAETVELNVLRQQKTELEAQRDLQQEIADIAARKAAVGMQEAQEKAANPNILEKMWNNIKETFGKGSETAKVLKDTDWSAWNNTARTEPAQVEALIRQYEKLSAEMESLDRLNEKDNKAYEEKNQKLLNIKSVLMSYVQQLQEYNASYKPAYDSIMEQKATNPDWVPSTEDRKIIEQYESNLALIDNLLYHITHETWAKNKLSELFNKEDLKGAEEALIAIAKAEGMLTPEILERMKSSLDETTRAFIEQASAARLTSKEICDGINDEVIAINKVQEEIDSMTFSESFKAASENIDKFQSSVASAYEAYSTLMGGDYSATELIDSMQAINAAMEEVGASVPWEELTSLEELEGRIDEGMRKFVEDSIAASTNLDTSTGFGKMLVDVTLAAQKAEQQMSALNGRIDLLQESYNSINDTITYYNENGFITIDQLQTLLAMKPEYLACLDAENGKLSMNKEAVDRLIALREAEINEQIVDNAVKYIAELRAKNLAKAADITGESLRKETVKLQSLSKGLADAATQMDLTTAQMEKLNKALDPESG